MRGGALCARNQVSVCSHPGLWWSEHIDAALRAGSGPERGASGSRFVSAEMDWRKGARDIIQRKPIVMEFRLVQACVQPTKHSMQRSPDFPQNSGF